MSDYMAEDASDFEGDLTKVQGFVEALDEQDVLLLDGMKLRQQFEVSMPQLSVIKRIFSSILAYDSSLISPFHTHADATGLRSQIRDARLKVKDRLNKLAFASSLPNSTTKAPMTQITEAPSPNAESPDPRRLFVVHGRNLAVRDAIFTLLRAIDLDPIEWEEAIQMTDQGSPYVGNVLDVAFSRAKAALVLLTGDDLARLGNRYASYHDPDHEKQLTQQARPNVLFELGMAFGRYPERTIIIEFGFTRPFTDIIGRNTIHFTDDAAGRKKIADRLKTAKCAVRTDFKADWLTAGDFATAFLFPDNVTAVKEPIFRVTRRYVRPAENDVYKPKIYAEIRNDGAASVEIRHMGWTESSAGIRIKQFLASMQLRIDRFWCPEKEGVERLHVAPGESFRAWVQPAAQHGIPDLEERCQSENRIGTLNLRVNDKDVDVAI